MKYNQNTKFTAIYWIFINCLLAASVPVLVKLKLSSISVVSIIAWYHAVAAVISYIWLLYIGDPIKTKRIFMHVLRAALIGVGYYFYFSASHYTSIANVVTLGYLTGPLTCFFAFLFLKEELTKMDLSNLFFSFLGAVLIIRPDLAMFNMGTIFALTSAILWGLSNIVIKKLSETDTTTTQLLYSNSLIFILFLPFTFGDSQKLEFTNMDSSSVIVFLGLMIFFQFYCLVKALEKAKTTLVMPFFAITVLAGDLLGYFLLGEKQDMLEHLGSLLIISVSMYQIICVKLGKI